MRRLTPLVLVLLAGCPAGPPSDAGGPPAEAGPTSAPTASASPAGSAEALAAAVARAAGLEAWAQVGTLRFTFHFPAKGIQRSYAWDVARGQVEVQADPAQDAWVSVPVAGFGPGDTPTPDRLQAHKTFVNDGFWALPCLHLAWDRGRTVEDLGTVAVPTLPALGKRRALALRYDVQAGGYTPATTTCSTWGTTTTRWRGRSTARGAPSRPSWRSGATRGPWAGCGSSASISPTAARSTSGSRT